ARTNAHQRNREWPISGGRSSADGVQTSAQAALQSARRLSNWFSSIFGHSAPDVDRPNRVQLVEEGGCRVTSNNEIKGSRSTAEKDVPAGYDGGGEIARFFASSQGDCACNIDPPASSYAITRRAGPYRGENSRPGKDDRGELGTEARN